jgi:glycosyltransferase involved in cell wall biosynthesis
VVITVRSALSVFAARFARRSVVAIGWEHADATSHPPELGADVRRSCGGLDAMVVLTAADQRAYREILAGSPARVERIPNALTPVRGEPAEEREKVVLAAGRMSRAKGLELAVEAFAPVAARHPDWKLRIHGHGVQEELIERLVAEHGLESSVELRPPTPHLGEAMAGAAVYALSSRREGFPLVLIEAMSKGMAVVAFDCPTGPGEVITDGEDGLLVPAEDVPAFSRALSRVIEDEELRRRLGAAAVATAHRYDLEPIGRRWEALLGSFGAAGRARPEVRPLTALR